MIPSNVIRLIAVLQLAAIAAAQTVSSPQGHLGTEGNSRQNFPFSSSTLRWQHIDSTQRGTTRRIGGLALRREGETWFSNPATARSLDLRIDLGRGNLATATTSFSNNITSAVSVLPRTTIRLPSWPALSTATPAAWAPTIPFRTHYMHFGSSDLVIDLRVFRNTSPTDKYFDAHDGTYIQGRAGKILPGCIPPFPPYALSSEVCNFIGTGDKFTRRLIGGPQNAVGFFAIGAQKMSYSPARCICPPCPPFPPGGKFVYPTLDLLFAFTTDGSGTWWPPAWNLTIPTAAVGTTVHMQAGVATSVSPGTPFGFAVTNGLDLVIPGQPKSAPKLRTYYDTNLTSKTATSTLPGGLVFRLN